MSTALPKWADGAFSAEIPDIIARGEGSHTEFKRQVPDNTHDLAKDIVAFATSGGGVVLVGVSNSGEVFGFAEDSVEARDQEMSRVRGIGDCCGFPIGSPAPRCPNNTYRELRRKITPIETVCRCKLARPCRPDCAAARKNLAPVFQHR